MLGSGLFKQWREADRIAHAWETAVWRAEMAACMGQGDPPSPEHHDTSHTLRARANELFHWAMAEMSRRADSNLP